MGQSCVAMRDKKLRITDNRCDNEIMEDIPIVGLHILRRKRQKYNPKGFKATEVVGRNGLA